MEQLDSHDKTEEYTGPSKPSSNNLTLQINPWVLVGLLSLACLVMIALWRPWSVSSSRSDRTVTVNGSATVQAEPDEYVFYPTYEFKNADKLAGLHDLTNKSTEVISGLKKLGIPDKDIKSNTSGYDEYYYYDDSSNLHTYSLTITATADSKDVAQKVQEYLVSTAPTGNVSPQMMFSEAKQKDLESEGRDKATKEARAKAEQQAKSLGFRLGAVKSVGDSGLGHDTVEPMSGMDSRANSSSSEAVEPSLTVQPGQNELVYTVQVVFYIK